MSRYLRTPRDAFLDAGIALCLLAPLMLCGAPALVSGCSDDTRTRVVTETVTVTETPDPTVPVYVYPASAQVPGVPAGDWHTTPAGVRVWVPLWLAQPARAGTLVAVLDEIDATAPLRDHRYVPDPIPPGVVGPPSGFAVVLMDGVFSARGYTAGPIVGLCDYDERQQRPEAIYVALTNGAVLDHLGRRLPAYAHELGHAHASRHAVRAVADDYGHWSTP